MSNSVSLLADAGHNLGDVLGLGVRMAGERARQACADRALHLRHARLVDPRRPVQRGLPSGDGRGPLMGGHPASRNARTRGGQDDDGGRGDRHPRPTPVTAWLFASGRKDDINLHGAFLHMASDALVSVGVGRGGASDPADKLALDRPGRQSRHQCRDRMGHVGPSARFRRHVDGGRSAPNRSRGGAETSFNARRRR